MLGCPTVHGCRFKLLYTELPAGVVFCFFMVINAHSRLTTCNNTTMWLNAGMYRHLQARLRSNAESVAFYGGIEKEGKIIVARFKELLRHHSRLLTKQWQFGMVQVSPAPLLPCAPSTYLHPPAAQSCFLSLGQICLSSCLVGCLFVMHKQLFPVQKQHPSSGMPHAKHVRCVHHAVVW